VIPLAAVLAIHPMPSGPDAAVIRSKLVQWFWCSVFGQAYENAPNSQAAKDVSELIAWIDGGVLPDTVATFKFDPRILVDTTPRQRALYRGTVCLILRKGARDFHTGQPISGDLIAKNFIDDHHIFPDSYLKKNHQTASARMRECVLNRTLIDRATNQHISDLAPTTYLAEIKTALGNEKFRKLLDSHFIPSEPLSPIWSDFAAFLEARRDLLWHEIKDVTGLEKESDLIDDADAA
jgi:hypothetical protein